jgi:hypothetical protein
MRLLFAAIAITVSTTAASAELSPGQVWSYHTRPGETASTVTVLKIETYRDLGRVVHIRIDGVNIKNPIKGNAITDIPHLPFKEAAVQKSITKLIRQAPAVPEFEDGYHTWREAYIAGKAGAFDIPVSATLDALLGANWEERK